MDYEINYEEIGQRIKAERLSKGLTLTELSKLAGCSANHLRNIETSKTRLSLTMIVNVAAALDTSVGYLAAGTPYIRQKHTVDPVLEEDIRKLDPAARQTFYKIVDALLQLQLQREGQA